MNESKSRPTSSMRYIGHFLVTLGTIALAFTMRILGVAMNSFRIQDASHWIIQDLPPPSSFQLASKQSFGFFDDVTDNQWKIAQKLHAKSFPNHFDKQPVKYSNAINDKRNPPNLKQSSHWYAENFQEEFHCTYRIGAIDPSCSSLL